MAEKASIGEPPTGGGFSNVLADAPLTFDRRRHPRRDAVHSCKLLQAESPRPSPAQTSNISAGGALVRLERSRPVRPGERVRVAVETETGPIVSERGMAPARVVRVVPIDAHHQAVALEYERPHEVAQAA